MHNVKRPIRLPPQKLSYRRTIALAWFRRLTDSAERFRSDRFVVVAPVIAARWILPDRHSFSREMDRRGAARREAGAWSALVSTPECPGARV